MRWLVIVLLVGAMVLSSGAVGETSATDKPAASKLIILMYGFFNSEDREKFDPKPIGYAFLRLAEAHVIIAERARSLEWPSPVHVLSWIESNAVMDRPYSEQEQELLRTRLWAALSVLDTTVQTGRVPAEQAVKLKAPLLPSDDWGAGDRVLTIIGLETVRRPDPKGLTSVLGCLWFSGEGSYLGLLAAPYDFTHFGTSELATTASEHCFRVSRED